MRGLFRCPSRFTNWLAIDYETASAPETVDSTDISTVLPRLEPPFSNLTLHASIRNLYMKPLDRGSFYLGRVRITGVQLLLLGGLG